MLAHGVSRGSGSSSGPAPAGAKDPGWETNYLHVVLRPSGAHSSICLVPRLAPWAIVWGLSEANPSAALGSKRLLFATGRELIKKGNALPRPIGERGRGEGERSQCANLGIKRSPFHGQVFPISMIWGDS